MSNSSAVKANEAPKTAKLDNLLVIPRDSAESVLRIYQEVTRKR